MNSPSHIKMENQEEQSSTIPAANAAAYQSAYEELFGPDASTASMKGAIVSHPLFPQLLAAHVACLRVATPLEQQHLIDAALANRHNVAVKYLALVNHMQSTSHPPDNDVQEVNYFMADYILLLQSFKDQLHHHLKTQALEAVAACQEIERSLFKLTGVSPRVEKSEGSSSCMDFCTEEDGVEEIQGLGQLGINAFLPYDIHKTLSDRVRHELKQELRKDYQSKLKEVRDEIHRKRRAGKLPEDTTHVLKDWWLSHANWPYPTEEDKAQLMEETGLELKQINNWFINQRKRSWKTDISSNEGGERIGADTKF